MGYDFNHNILAIMKRIQSIPIPPNSPSISLRDITNLEPFYNGEYCDVFKIVKYGTQYAVKLIYGDRMESNYLQELGRVYNEITILYSVKHEGIIQLLGHFVEDNKIGLIFPIFGRPISEFIKGKRKKTNSNSTFTLKQFLTIFRNIGLAIHELYVKGYVHRDISEDNILIDENLNTKLIDFGFVCSIDHCKGDFGTKQYQCPEILANKWYNHKADVWSFGILCYLLLYGVYLFRPKGKNFSDVELNKQYLMNMMQPIEDFPDQRLLVDEKPGDEMLSYIKSMLAYNPDKRSEIGYLLSKKIFGAEEREAETYNINQYVRQKTFRKSNKPQNLIHSNVKQMNVAELEQILLNLVQQTVLQFDRKKQLLKTLAQEQKKLCVKKKQYWEWKNKNLN